MTNSTNIAQQSLADQDLANSEFHNHPQQNGATQSDINTQILDLLFERSYIGKVLINSQRQIVRVNQAYAQLLGYLPEELIGLSSDTLIHPNDLPASLEQFTKMLDDASFTAQQRKRYITRDGHTIWVERTASRIEIAGHIFGLGEIVDVTSQVEAEHALAESTRQLTFITNTTQTFITYCDTDLRLKYVNIAYAARFGLEPADCIGKHLSEIIGEQAYNLCRSYIEQAAQGQTVTFELNVPYNTIGLRYVHCTIIPEHQTDGRIIGLVARITDLTEHKRSEAALAAIQEQVHRQLEELETIYHTTPIGLALLDNQGYFVRINERLAEMNGLSVIEHIGHSIHEILPHIADQTEELIRQIVATGAPQLDIEIVGETAAQPGVRRVWNESWYPLKDEAGTVAAINVVVEEITERRRSEEMRAHYTWQFEKLADTAHSLQSTFDLKQIMQLAAEHARIIIGAQQGFSYTLPESENEQPVVAVSCDASCTLCMQSDQMIHTASLDRLVCQMNKPVRLTQLQLELHTLWNELRPVVEKYQLGPGWLAVPLRGHEGRNLGFIRVAHKFEGEFVDGDESMLMQLAQLVSAAIESSLLYQAAQQAIHIRDAFVSVAAHELKTPLTSLMGNAQLLLMRARRDISRDDPNERALYAIMDQASRLNKRITSLLDASRIDTNQLSIEQYPLDLCRLVERTVTELKQGDTLHTLNYECFAPYLMVLGDELRLEQVFQNLIQNAIKYSPDGGTITVRVTQEEHQVCILVIDQGMGIPESAIPRLFERFYRVENSDKRPISGMGIGLFVSREIVSLHGGTISVESLEGVGSTFKVYLPLL